VKHRDPGAALGHIVEQSRLHQGWMIVPIGAQRPQRGYRVALICGWHTFEESPLRRRGEHRIDQRAVIVGYPSADGLEELG
jgi:hypothetical protein